MKSEREVKNGGVEEERDAKRKRVIESSNDHDVEEAENEQKKDNGAARVEEKSTIGLDDDEGRGKRSRHVEVRRDCPYLDTVNRQVMYLSLIICYCVLGISIFSMFLDVEFHSGFGF